MFAETCPFCEYLEFTDPDPPEAVGESAASRRERHRRAFWWALGLSFVLGMSWRVIFTICCVGAVVFYQSSPNPNPGSVAAATTGARKKKFLVPEFKCQNPTCLRVSCRECRLISHTPYHCNDPQNPANIGPQGLEGLRLFVENAMAEALVRTCPQCGLNFLKLDGCNKMGIHELPSPPRSMTLPPKKWPSKLTDLLIFFFFC